MAEEIAYYSLLKAKNNFFSSPYVFKEKKLAQEMEEILNKNTQEASTSYSVEENKAVLDEGMLINFNKHINKSLNKLNKLRGNTHE